MSSPTKLIVPASPREVRTASKLLHKEMAIGHIDQPLHGTELPARPTERAGVSDQYQVRDKRMECKLKAAEQQHKEIATDRFYTGF